MEAWTVELRGMAFFKAKNVYSGDHDGMAYSLALGDDGFCARVWPGPWCAQKTPPDAQRTQSFPGDAHGLHSAGAWIAAQYEAAPEQWHVHAGFSGWQMADAAAKGAAENEVSARAT